SEKNFDLAILPWGATEAHNNHLPYGTDNYETEAIAREALKRVSEKGVNAVLLPGIPFGVNTGQNDIPLTINMNPSTQMMVLKDILESLERSGIHKFLLMNGHGGNDFRQILRELGNEFPDMILATCNWFQSVEKSKFFENEGDHADEMETSLMMHLHADLVLPLNEAGSGKAKSFKVKALNEKWAWTERKWTKVSEDTGIGDPSRSSAEKGEKYFNAVCDKIGDLIYELALINGEDFYF
ncbi:MAG: creatininase family protein, partial [Bacteroidales bacterium]